MSWNHTSRITVWVTLNYKNTKSWTKGHDTEIVHQFLLTPVMVHMHSCRVWEKLRFPLFKCSQNIFEKLRFPLLPWWQNWTIVKKRLFFFLHLHEELGESFLSRSKHDKTFHFHIRRQADAVFTGWCMFLSERKEFFFFSYSFVISEGSDFEILSFNFLDCHRLYK